MKLESPSRGRDRKHIFWNNGQNFCKFDKNCKPTDLTILTNPKHKKNKATTSYVKIYLFKTNDEEKKFKINQR